MASSGEDWVLNTVLGGMMMMMLMMMMMMMMLMMMMMTMLTDKEWPPVEKIGCLIWFSGGFPTKPSFQSNSRFYTLPL